MTDKTEKRPQGPVDKRHRSGKPFDFKSLPRCTAKSKTTGKQCRQPAMKNGKCYWHGGKSPGPPLGNQNALQTGLYTQYMIDQRKIFRALMKECRDVLRRFI